MKEMFSFDSLVGSYYSTSAAQVLYHDTIQKTL